MVGGGSGCGDSGGVGTGGGFQKSYEPKYLKTKQVKE